MQIKYRKAQIEDAGILNLFMEQLIEAPGNIAKIQQQIERISQNNHYYLCIAYDSENKNAIGTAMGVLLEDICEQCQRFLVIENVFVSPEYRGHGIAKGIFQELEIWAKQNNSYYAILVSENHRETAHRFYQKAGYKKMGGFKKIF